MGWMAVIVGQIASGAGLRVVRIFRTYGNSMLGGLMYRLVEAVVTSLCCRSLARQNLAERQLQHLTGLPSVRPALRTNPLIG